MYPVAPILTMLHTHAAYLHVCDGQDQQLSTLLWLQDHGLRGLVLM